MKYLVCEIDSDEMERRRPRPPQIFLPSGDWENRKRLATAFVARTLP